MLRYQIMVPLALLGMSCCASIAQAQVGGSYQDSCENIRQRGPYLRAECRNVDGDYVRSSLDLRGCRGGVSNNNGRLTCGHGGYGDDRGFRPRWRRNYDDEN